MMAPESTIAALAHDLVVLLIESGAAQDIAPNLTCTEADAFAVLLHACGQDSESFLDRHSQGDDEFDAHFLASQA